METSSISQGASDVAKVAHDPFPDRSPSSDSTSATPKTLLPNDTNRGPDKLNAIEASSTSRLKPETWKTYVERASNEDKEFVNRWNLEMDTLLLFATLFSAVLAAFVIESYKYLQADSSQSTVDVLQQILYTLQANRSAVLDTPASASTTQEFHPTASAIRVNSFWFAALILSLSTSFLAILAKQWLFSLSSGFSSDLETSGRQHQYRHDSLQTWRLESVLSSLPILLHISLLLFFAGLVDFLWSINTTVGIVAAAIISIPVFIYFGTHTVSLIRLTCPYRTSVTLFILAGIDTTSQEVVAILIAFAWILTKHFLMVFGLFEEASVREVFKTFSLISGRRLREAIKQIWVKKVSPMATPQFWEDKFISNHFKTVDSHAVTRMIRMLPAADPDRHSLAQEVAHFDNLIAHKSIFIEGGAGELLAQELHAVCLAASKASSAEQRAVIKSFSGALATLFTEADAEDMNSLMATVDGIPYHLGLYRHKLRAVIDFLSQTFSLTPYNVDHIYSHEDIMVLSNMLRLHIVVAAAAEAYLPEIQSAASVFFSRLRDAEVVARVTNDTLTSLVNTVIYDAIYCLESEDSWELPAYIAQTLPMLDTLAAVALNKPDMSMPVRRQICWGIWLCSKPYLAYIWGVLVPVIKSTAPLSAPLAACLLSDASSPSLWHTILCVLEGLLYHIPDSDAEDYEEHMQLLSALVKSYPSYLAQSKSSEQDHGYTLRLLSRIVRISDRLASSATNNWSVDVERVVSDTLRILYQVFEHLNDLPPRDQTAAFRLVIGTVCHMVRLQSYPNEPPETHTPITPLPFDDDTPQSLADLLISVLRAAPLLSSDNLKIVLVVIGLLRRPMRGDVGDFQDAFLAHLCDPKIGAVSLLLPLKDGMLGEAANDALDTIQMLDPKKMTAVSRWQTSKPSRHGSPHHVDLIMKSKKYVRLVASLPRGHARILMQLKSGRAPLQQHLFQTHRAQTDQCPACLRHRESVHHYLLECPAYRTHRETLRREIGQSARSVRTLLLNPQAIKPLLRYIHATGRFSSMGHLEMHENGAHVTN